MQRAQLSVGPAATLRAQDRAHAAGAHAHAHAVRSRACPNYVPAEARLPPRDAQLALPSARANAPPRLFCLRLARCSPGADSRSCERSGSTATAPSTSPPRPAGATSTPRS
jgi:hypothetical protein